MSSINSLYFNDIEVEEDFRSLLSALFSTKEIYSLFGREINFIPIDYVVGKDVDLPAVDFQIIESTTINTDDEQNHRYSEFSVNINVYTSGKNKVLKNRKLCNEIIKTLQSNGAMEHYYCRGLVLESNNDFNGIVDDCYRRTIIMSGLCDNENKLIKGERK